MNRILGFLKHNAIALAALFVALGGTSYAAVAIPSNSVGSRQLRKGAVTSTKIRSGAITPGKLAGRSFGGRILYFAEIENSGAIAAAYPTGIKTKGWSAASGGSVIFPRQISNGCYPLVSAASTFSPTVDGAPASVGAAIQGPHVVAVAVNYPVPITLAIVCAK